MGSSTEVGSCKASAAAMSASMCHERLERLIGKRFLAVLFPICALKSTSILIGGVGKAEDSASPQSIHLLLPQPLTQQQMGEKELMQPVLT